MNNPAFSMRSGPDRVKGGPAGWVLQPPVSTTEGLPPSSGEMPSEGGCPGGRGHGSLGTSLGTGHDVSRPWLHECAEEGGPSCPFVVHRSCWGSSERCCSSWG